ncbi:MAG: 7TM domain-containing protein [Patescibacteria group bacterium]
MKKILWAILVLLLNIAPAVAQEENILKEEIRTRILSPVGKQIVFDAGEMVKENINYDEYHWSFGDGGSAEGKGVLHSYMQPGYYEVKLATTKEDLGDNYYIDVYIYNSLFVGVIDNSIDRDYVSSVENYVFERGALFWIIGGVDKNVTVDEIVDEVISNSEIVNKASGMVVWGAGNFGLDLLVKLSQRSEIDFGDLNVAIVTAGRLSSLTKTAYSSFNLVNPQSLILIGDNALKNIVNLSDTDGFVSSLEEEALAYELIGIKDRFRLEPVASWMLMTRLISYILFKGVPLSTIALILTIPIIALLIALARQVVGIKAFGIYVPSLITLAFLESGLRYGTVVFLVVLAVGTIARLVLKKLRILYLPRMALILTAVALGLLLMMGVASYFNVSGLKTLSIVPLLTMVILTEKFVSAQIRYGFGPALKLTWETFVLSAVCYLLVGWESLKVFIVSYPEWLLLVIPILILLGRWTGLRVLEYWRFRRVINK